MKNGMRKGKWNEKMGKVYVKEWEEIGKSWK